MAVNPNNFIHFLVGRLSGTPEFEKKHPEEVMEYLQNEFAESFPADCCNKAVFWNPFNEVVQCHVCGQIFTPKEVAE